MKHETHTVRAMIVTFLNSRIKHNQPDFHAQELRDYVNSWGIRTAPASADRILRDVKKRGVGNYIVTNRNQSRYRAVK